MAVDPSEMSLETPPNETDPIDNSSGGTIRTASRSLPLMRRNPICKASPNLSSGRRPKNVACQLSIAPSLKGHDTPGQNVISKSLNQKPESTSTSAITGKSYRM